MRFMVASGAGGGGAAAVYAVEGDTAVNLSGADASFGEDLSALIAMGDAGLERAAAIAAATAEDERVPLDSLTPALPLPRPGKIICLGLNYADHAKEGGHEVPDYPALPLPLRPPASLHHSELRERSKRNAKHIVDCLFVDGRCNSDGET